MAAGDQAELVLYLNTAFAIPASALAGLYQIGLALNRVSPIAALGALGLGVASVILLDRKIPSIRTHLETISRFYSDELMMPHHHASRKVKSLIPDIPEWNDLSETNSSSQVLARAMMHTLARKRQDLLTARDISQLLPNLQVPAIAPRVGRILRNGCFVQTYRSCWQLGTALED